MDPAPTAAFDASFPIDDENWHPPGCYLARILRNRLARVASSVQEFENWRDCGWSLGCEINGQRFEVFFSAINAYPNPTQWMIGISPIGHPGALRRLFGAKALPYIRECRQLTQEIQRLLESDPSVSNIRWAMNSYPSKSSIRDPAGLVWPDSSVS